jgi:hypothetical protein
MCEFVRTSISVFLEVDAGVRSGAADEIVAEVDERLRHYPDTPGKK